MAQFINRCIPISIAADCAGMGGVTIFCTDRIRYHCMIVMAVGRYRFRFNFTATMTGSGPFTGFGTGRRNGNVPWTHIVAKRCSFHLCHKDSIADCAVTAFGKAWLCAGNGSNIRHGRMEQSVTLAFVRLMNKNRKLCRGAQNRDRNRLFTGRRKICGVIR